MAANLQRILVENKDMVVKIMDVLEKGSEVVASIAGDLFPVFSIAAPLVRLALDKVESKEATFMKEQFQKVQEALKVVSEQLQHINHQRKKSMMDDEFFSVEENISSQFRKYMDILNAKPEYREVEKEEFLTLFDKSEGDKNLNILYEAVTGVNFHGQTVLKITLDYYKKSRRVVEDFCARLNKLFCIGIIALLGYTILKSHGKENEILNGHDKETKIINEWKEKMNDVQDKMNAVIKECIVSFPEQAKDDCDQFVKDHSEMTNQQLAAALIELLKKKYDWVYWSVRIFKTPTCLFANKKHSHCPTMESHFQVTSSGEKLNIMVSYSVSPKPINNLHITELLKQKKQKKSTVVDVAKMLFENLPGSNVVHTVKTTDDLVCSSSFNPELHYWEKHNNLSVCTHSA